MSGSVNWDSLGPRVTITWLDDGTTRTLPLEMLESGDYLDVAQSPDEGFPPPLAIGPAPQRSDLRTRQVIFQDWRRGMGQDEYDETQGLTTFRDSQCETRYPNVLVCRALPTRLGSSSTVTVGAYADRAFYVGSATARWFVYGSATSSYFSESTSQWVATAMTNCGIFFVHGPGGMYLMYDSYTKIGRSVNGSTWAALDVSDIDTAVTYASPPTLAGLVLHDHKLFTVAQTSARGWSLFQSTDAVDTDSCNWTQLGTFALDGMQEGIKQLFVWKFPPDPGRPGLFCLTSHRLLYYDDTADVASPTAWKEWHSWGQAWAPSYAPFAFVWPKTGDLYVMPSVATDDIYQFTGNNITPHGPNPNLRGGLPPTKQGAIFYAAGNHHAIVAWVRGSGSVGGTNKGMTVAFTEQEGWHHVLSDSFTTPKIIYGGGIGPNTVLSILEGGICYTQEFYDSSELPQYATTARNYDTTALNHDTAKTDIGSSTLPKAALYYELNARIPTGATVAVAYRMDDYDQTGAWAALGTATASSPMPYRIGFADDTQFVQAEIRYTLTRGTAASATPIVRSGILHATLLPPARFNTVFRVDIREERFPNPVRASGGYGFLELRDFLHASHGKMCSFVVQHPGSVLNVTRCQLAVTPIENPLSGLGRYSIQARDLTTPVSGV